MKKTTHVRVNCDALEGLRSLVLKKYGQTHGYLGPEASRAFEEYIHAHRPEVEQQHQKKMFGSMRGDVKRKFGLIQHGIHNDFGVTSKIQGFRLAGIIVDIYMKEENRKPVLRTIKDRIQDLIDRRVIKFVPGSGQPKRLGKEEYELI